MIIGGLQKSSFVDFPGNIAAVVFTHGCNMNCFFCHNKRLLRAMPENEIIQEDEVISFLKTRQGLLDGVVITGGEPTLNKDLLEFILKIKALGFKVKLDTNGSNPERLKEVIDSVDFVAMDIKAPFERYEQFCGVPNMVDRVRESMKIIIESGKPHQFRTTMAPGLEAEDADIIKGYVPATSEYKLQKYRVPEE